MNIPEKLRLKFSPDPVVNDYVVFRSEKLVWLDEKRVIFGKLSFLKELINPLTGDTVRTDIYIVIVSSKTGNYAVFKPFDVKVGADYEGLVGLPNPSIDSMNCLVVFELGGIYDKKGELDIKKTNKLSNMSLIIERDVDSIIEDIVG